MLQLLPPDDCRRLIDLFSESGYTTERVQAAGLKVHVPGCRGSTLEYLLEKTAEPSAFHTLARWFIIGVAISFEDAARQLPEWAVALMIESGMLRENAGQLDPAVMMLPLGSLLLASDPMRKWEEDPADLILWLSPSTELLFHLTIRKPAGSALDVGCGCGIHALAATQHCQSVVATDLNPRAAQFTSFNARLNGVANVESVTGDCFAPVCERTFDLIVANPPFYIMPGSGLLYCENNLELDLFCRRLARDAPRHLNESGFFQMVCQWVEIEGQPWQERIAEWMEATGCDAWVIRQFSMNAFQYGVDRMNQLPPTSDAGAFFASWIAYLREKKIVAVHSGVITMRKRSGGNWLRVDAEPVSLSVPIGHLILEGFRARDVLDENNDEQLMQLRPRLAKDARLTQVLAQADQGWNSQSLRLQLAGPRRREIDVDPGVAHFLSGLNGKERLADRIRLLAEQANAPAERVVQESMTIVRKLLAEGYLGI